MYDGAQELEVSSGPQKLGYLLGGGVWHYSAGTPVKLPPAGSLPRKFFDSLRYHGWVWRPYTSVPNIEIIVRTAKTQTDVGNAAKAFEKDDKVAAIMLPVTRDIPETLAKTSTTPIIVAKTYDKVLEAEITKKGGDTDKRIIGLTIDTRDYALQLLNLVQYTVP